MNGIFLSVLNMSIAASYCILAVIIIRLLLKKQPKIFSYALWAIVLFRLVCPISLKSPFSLMKVSNQTIPRDIVMQPHPQINSGIKAIDQTVNQVIENQGASANSVNILQLIVSISALIWAAGILFLLIKSIISILKLRPALKTAALSNENVYKVENLKTAFLIGIIKPKIYLPASLTMAEKSYIIEHEKVHIRRLDYLIKGCAYVVLCIHWFNPLVWLAFKLMVQDMEMSCDEAVIRKLGTGIKRDYSMSLLSMASGRHSIYDGALPFGEGVVKERIRNVLIYKKKAAVITILLAVVVAVLSICLLLNPNDEKQILTRNEVRNEGSANIEQQELVKKYAEAFTNRDGETIASLYPSEEAALQNIWLDTDHTFGLSSPWPWNADYWVVFDHDMAEIYFYALASDPHVTVYLDKVYYQNIDGEYKITKNEFKSFDNIESLADFNEAFMIDGSWHVYDYEKNGLADSIIMHIDNGMEGYNQYTKADTAAAYILNLNGGKVAISNSSGDNWIVSYEFADGSIVQIPMYAYKKSDSDTVIWLVKPEV